MINVFNDYMDASMRMRNFRVGRARGLRLLVTGFIVGIICYMGVM